jgi:hypothetical protein
MITGYIFENPDVLMAIQPGSNTLRLEYGTTDRIYNLSQPNSPLSEVFLAGEDLDDRAAISIWSEPGNCLCVCYSQE